MNKLNLPPSGQQKGRVVAYCTCDQIEVLELLNWLNKLSKKHPLRDERSQGPHLQLRGWKHTMHMNVIHSTHTPSERYVCLTTIHSGTDLTCV
jgi:hypothetical protein